MVRLEVRVAYCALLNSTVSIPIWCDWKESRLSLGHYVLSFNSYMVRLEATLSTSPSFKASCFNSYMVRLEDFFTKCYTQLEQMFQFLYGAIGRPQAVKIESMIASFQFLYGAIGRRSAFLISLASCCFNSYMVRLEVRFSIDLISLSIVSIPIWCDWKQF